MRLDTPTASASAIRRAAAFACRQQSSRERAGLLLSMVADA